MSDVSVIFRLLAVDETGKGLESASGKFRETMKGIGEALAVGELVNFGREAISAADSASRVFAQTQQVISNSHGAIKLSADDVRELADKYGELAGVSGDATQSALNFVLRSSQVQQAMSKGAISGADLTQTLLNVSAAMAKGGKTTDSMGDAATLLTKALQNPFTATKALAYIGDGLTASQVRQLAAFKKSGDVAGAYKLILGQVSAATQGMAAANTTPMQQLSAKWEDMKVAIGQRLMPVVTQFIGVLLKLVPVIGLVFGWVSKLIGFVVSHGNIFGPMAAGIASVVGAIKLANFATFVWKDGIKALFTLVMDNPWVAFATLAATVIIALAVKFKGFRDFLAEVFGFIAKTVATVFKYIWDTVSSVITHILDAASHIPIIGGKFKAAADGVRAFTGEVNNAISAVQNFDFVAGSNALFNSLTNMLKIPSYSAPSFSGGGLGNLGDAIGKNIGGAAPKAVAATESLAQKVQDALSKFKDKIVQSFGSMGSLISNAMAGPPGSNFLVGNLQGQLNKAKQFVADISTLRKFGLNASSLNELISAGPDQGADAARQLATTGLGSIGQVNSLESQLNTLGNAFANQTAKAEFGSTQGALQRNQVYLNFDMSGVSTDDFVKALRKAIRVKGGNVQTVLGGGA